MTVKEPDGRSLRRVTTTRKLVHAHAELLREGELTPTAAQVAARAEVSLRTFWTVFVDIEAMLQETTRFWAEQEAELHTSIDPSLDLTERIQLFCDVRQRRFEFVAPAARATGLRVHGSEALRENRKAAIAELQTFVEETFATELGGAQAVRDRITAAANWDTWLFYTDDLGYSPDAARAQLAQVIHNEFFPAASD